MYRYQILIEYEGTKFIGWQTQKKGNSVQYLLNENEMQEYLINEGLKDLILLKPTSDKKFSQISC